MTTLRERIVIGWQERIWPFKWTSPEWWRYVWQPPIVSYRTNARSWSGTYGKWRVRFCRLRGHPGIVYFNPGGMEPDTSCTRCGEDIG